MHSKQNKADRLYPLLPALLQIRDYENGQPLRALLQVIAEQVNLVEDNIQRLYDNWFIETCEDWVVPYLGDLVGEEPVHEAGEPGDVATARSRARNRILTPRREVANAIRSRRRKGTLALLELLARDVAGWPARVVEFRRQLAQYVKVNSRAPHRGRMVDVRSGARLDHIGGAFDGLTRLPDLRRVNSAHGGGLFNVPAVGVFVWRLRAYSITNAPARCLDPVGPHCYTFSTLGNDVPLFNRPIAQGDPNAIAGDFNVPAPIDRRDFSRVVVVDGKREMRASDRYYGLIDAAGSRIAQSVSIWAPGWPPNQDRGDAPIASDSIVPADLTGWKYVPRTGQIAVDPVRGRIAFPPRQLPKQGVWVSYHYGFSADIGGGEYTRSLAQHKDATVTRVSGKDELQAALVPWRRQGGAPVAPAPAHAGQPQADQPQRDQPLPPQQSNQPAHAVIEITDSGVYVIPINIYLEAGHSLQIRAAQRTRPVIQLLDWHSNLPDNLTVTGEAGSQLTLDGILVAGRGVQVEGDLRTLMVRHSTLVPGWSLEPNCDPQRPAEPSVELIDSRACVVIEHSIVGSIQVNDNEVNTEPARIRISDSVVDATGTDCDSPECEAIGASGSRLAYAVLTVSSSTVIGRVMAHAIELAENSIFLSRVTVARRQMGCMRFCYVRPDSRTPRRFNCQPDLVERAVTAAMAGTLATDAPQQGALDMERWRVRPQFNSTRYGRPTYCQLAETCAAEIVRGADDESEMGVFHDLFQPQRLANLRARLDEFAPAATDTGIILET